MKVLFIKQLKFNLVLLQKLRRRIRIRFYGLRIRDSVSGLHRLFKLNIIYICNKTTDLNRNGV